MSQTYSDVNGANGMLRTTMNTAHAPRKMLIVFGPMAGVGSCLPLIFFTAQARYSQTRNGAANTAIAWWRAASGMLPCIR